MIRNIIIVAVATLWSLPLYGQGSSERVAHRNLIRGKWQKAYSQLTNILAKDSLHCGASYVLAVYYFSPTNPGFQPDSAYHFVQQSLQHFRGSTAKQRERLKRNDIDSLSIVSLRAQIDSACFVRVRERDEEAGYITFLQAHLTSEYRDEAMMLRNEAAYRSAEKANTHQAFEDFISRYPNSSRKAEAMLRYEALLFEEKTRDKRLASYERYLFENPRSPYARTAEQAIFEIRTALGSRAVYTAFLDRYKGSAGAEQARNILFHLVPEDRRQIELNSYLNDSLRAVISRDRGYLVPFFHLGKFGFMNQAGEEVIAGEAAAIDPAYVCGEVTDDFIVLPDEVVTPRGQSIVRCVALSVEDLGSGFLLLEEQGCLRVIHKTGFEVGSGCVSGAKIVSEKFLALQENDRWSLWTFTGRMLVPFEWDDVYAIKDIIVLKQNNRYILTTAEKIAEIADQQALRVTGAVDEVKMWRNNFLWFRYGTDQGIVNLSLDTLVQPAPPTLTSAYFGAVSLDREGSRTFNSRGEKSIDFSRIAVREPWTAVSLDSSWRLYDPVRRLFLSPEFDSIRFEGPFALGLRKDSARIYFSATHAKSFPQPVRAIFIPGQDSSSFLLVDHQEKKSLYTAKGDKRFVVDYDDIQYAGEGFFAVVKKGKKGMITSSGKLLLPAKFDAIGTVNNGMVSLLTGGKFGLFDCSKRKLIKPLYEKNLTCYNDKIIIVFKEGAYGFVDWDNKSLSTVEFDEVKYWNDSTAFVRKGTGWMLYEIKTKRIVLDKIREFRFIRDERDDKLAIVQQERSFGVLHNLKGTIIPVSFSDILNVGSRETPLYFTEKHVEEASIFVVIYYDNRGKMIRKEVYEQDDYEKIYCSD